MFVTDSAKPCRHCKNYESCKYFNLALDTCGKTVAKKTDCDPRACKPNCHCTCTA